MSRYNFSKVLLTLIFLFSVAGCTAPENKEDTIQNTSVIGGVAVGISPKIIYADKGENVTFSIDLVSTENAEDRVTIQIHDTWIDRTVKQDIQAGKSISIPIHIKVPVDAGNTSFKVNAISNNLKATSSTSGVILIKAKGD